MWISGGTVQWSSSAGNPHESWQADKAWFSDENSLWGHDFINS